jgi:hypothetical protein
MGFSSWSEVQAHLRSKYRLQQDEAQSFLLAFALDGGTPAQSSLPGGDPPLVQGVKGHPVLIEGRAFLVLRAEVCTDRALSQEDALRHSARLVLGALALSGNQYILRYCAPLSSLEPADLDYALEYLAREAGMTRARLAQHNGNPERANRMPHWSE